VPALKGSLLNFNKINMKNYVIGSRCFKNMYCARLQLYFPVRIRTALSFFFFANMRNFEGNSTDFQKISKPRKSSSERLKLLYVLVNAPVRVDSKSHFPLSPYRKMSRMLSSTLKYFEYFRENVKFFFCIFVSAPLNFCDYSDPFL